MRDKQEKQIIENRETIESLRDSQIGMSNKTEASNIAFSPSEIKHKCEGLDCQTCKDLRIGEEEGFI